MSIAVCLNYLFINYNNAVSKLKVWLVFNLLRRDSLPDLSALPNLCKERNNNLECGGLIVTTFPPQKKINP